jgi:hypothetical protein
MSKGMRGAVAGALVALAAGGATVAQAGLTSINFAPKRDYPAGVRPFGIVKTDLNKDGKLDLAIADSDGVGVLFGRGDGTFRPLRLFHTPGGLEDLRVADLNHDGRKDVVGADYDNNQITVLLGKRGGGFAMPASYPTLAFPFSPVLRDFNGDGRKDIAVADQDSQHVSVLLGRRGGRFRHRTDYLVGGRPYYIAVADYNHDGRKDLAVTAFDDDNVDVLYGRRDGTFGDRRSFPAGDGPYPIIARDLNRDGRPDLIVGNFNAGNIVVIKGKPGGFRAPRPVLTQPSIYFLNLTDVDLDHKLDLVSVNIETSDGTDGLAVQKGLGGSRFNASPVYFQTGGFPYAIAAGRFNRDRAPDLVVSNSALGADTVSFFRNRR